MKALYSCFARDHHEDHGFSSKRIETVCSRLEQNEYPQSSVSNEIGHFKEMKRHLGDIHQTLRGRFFTRAFFIPLYDLLNHYA